MKKINIYLSFLLILAFVFTACEEQNMPEPLIIQKKEIKSAEYYANLRAYKRSDHAIAFGWFGGWTATGACSKSCLSNIPDSMDVVSIWGKADCFNLTPEKKADLKHVQEVKGTKVLMCWIVSNVGDAIGVEHFPDGMTFENFKGKEARIAAYAKAIADTIYKYNLDGFDIDFEPNYSPHGAGDIAKKGFGIQQDTMHFFVSQLGRYLGPESGTDKLLCIDGEPDQLNKETGKYFSYYISQAYDCSGPADLQRRFNSMSHLEGFAPEKYIVTENFEAHWKKGGVNYRDENGNTMPSLLGMATWNPKEGRKGGVGAFHFEYEFVHNPDYKFMREAIQIQNPAVK